VTARWAVLGCALAACGDNRELADTAAVDARQAAPACTAAFSEDFTESSAGPANCATLATADGDTMLQLSIPSQTIAAAFEISIDLGAAPGAGTYTSESLIAPWSASGLHEFDMTSCFYHAGTAAVPPGRFALVLDELDHSDGPAGGQVHGTLDLVLAVLSRPYTYCGETNIERLVVTF